jgi:hypothetical protein
MTSKTEDHTSSSGRKWSTVAEKVWFPCLGSIPSLQVYNSEKEARTAFKGLKGPRILIDESGAEVLAVAGAPWKRYALRRIRQALKLNSFCLPHLSARKQPKDLCDMAEFGFADNDPLLFDDFTGTARAVELPTKKRSRSDSESTIADQGSSRTTLSAFTMSQVDICQSTSSSGCKKNSVDVCQSTSSSGSKKGLVDICQSTSSSGSNEGSVDICQSTSSSVYRLLDLSCSVDICESSSSSVYHNYNKQL